MTPCFQSTSANYDSLWFDFGDGNGTHLDLAFTHAVVIGTPPSRWHWNVAMEIRPALLYSPPTLSPWQNFPMKTLTLFH